MISSAKDCVVVRRSASSRSFSLPFFSGSTQRWSTSVVGGGEMGAYGDSQGVRDMLGGLFCTVTIQPPPPSEQLQILASAFPVLRPEVVAGCMASLHLSKRAGGQAASSLGDDLSAFGPKKSVWAGEVEDAMASAGLKTGDLATHFGHHFSLRTLFKLCQRLQVDLRGFLG